MFVMRYAKSHRGSCNTVPLVTSSKCMRTSEDMHELTTEEIRKLSWAKLA